MKIKPTNIDTIPLRERVVWLFNKNISKRKSMTWLRVQLIRYVDRIRNVASQNFKGIDARDKGAR